MELKKRSSSKQIIWKITGDCNLRCTYCHFFADSKVDQYPVKATVVVIDKILYRLQEFVEGSDLSLLKVHLEGGEPLIIGKERFTYICDGLKRIEEVTKCRVRITLTSNGTIIDSDWIALFKRYISSIAISLDGPEEMNYKRVGLTGKSSFKKMKQGLILVQNSGIKYGCLVVANPATSVEKLLYGIVDEMGITSFDVLIPKYDYNDLLYSGYESISNYYKSLYRHWYEDYSKRNVKIRICGDLTLAVLKQKSGIRTISSKVESLLLIESNGDLQPLYNQIYKKQEYVQPNVEDSDLLSVITSPIWMLMESDIRKEPKECEGCKWLKICGGGIPYTRFSNSNGFDNRTLYCEDMKDIFSFVEDKVTKDLYVT